jgi:hypothetical protein
MTTLTPDDITKIVEIAVRSALATHKPTTPQGAWEKGHLDERFFRRVEKFDGSGKSNWREFAFQFKVAVGMVNPKARSMLEEIQKKGKDVNFTEVFGAGDDMEDLQAEHVQKMGAELYAMLSSLVAGEAMTVVRGVMSGDGWLAWSKLNIRFDPRTPAKALISMLAVMSPKKQKDIAQLAAAIEDWEMKVKSLGSEHDITMDDKIMQAVLTSMCPEEVQNLIFQWADDKSRYKDIRDKVIALSQNRAAEKRPKPMEVDQVREHNWYTEWEHSKEEETDWGEEGAEVQVDYVGESCLRCGGLGHYARECPTPKGKGKGGKGDFGKNGLKGGGKGDYGKNNWYKGGGKGDYGKNNWYKGGGKGDFGKSGSKGSGKGFNGNCFKCGEAGHRAFHCPKAAGGAGSSMEIGAVGEEGQASVGGVWEIAAVEAEGWKDVKGKPKEINQNKPVKLECKNRWEVLSMEGDMEQEKVEEVQTAVWPNLEQCREMNKKKGKMVRFKVTGAKKIDENIVCRTCDQEAVSICAVPFASCCSAPPGLDVCTVSSASGWRKIGAGEITIDSAAEESVCPKEWAKEFGTKEVEKKLKFVNASGGVMGHYGERVAIFKTMGQEAAVMSLTFQVSDVQKPLAAVRRIAEKGNVVQFGPRAEDNFIQNAATGMKIMMMKKGGSYVVPAELMMKDSGFTRRAQ